MQYSYYNRGGGFLSNIPPVTKNLLIINIIIYLATALNKEFMYSAFALFYPSSHYFHWWQLVTHMFMHGSFTHLFFNMFALFTFGSRVENSIGSKKFLILYFVAGFGAVALHFGAMHIELAVLKSQMEEGVLSAINSYATIKTIPTVGASGAIYGLLLTFALLYPSSRLTLIFPPISMSAKTWVIVFAVIELVMGLGNLRSGVAHFAHLGGMLFAWGLITYWRKKRTLFSGYRQF